MRKKQARRADASPARGSADSAARLTELDREITRKQSELRAAKAAAREARLGAGAENSDSTKRDSRRSAGTGADNVARLRKLDREITRTQAELRAAKRRQRKQAQVSHEEILGAKTTLHEQPTAERIPESAAPVTVPASADERQRVDDGSAVGASRTPARSSARARLPALGRRLALVALLVAVASISGLVAGWLTDSSNGDGATLAPDRAAPVADYGRTLNREVETLATRRGSELKQFREARTRAAQASATKDLAAAHRRAAGSLQRIPAPSRLQPTNDSLVTALRRVANAYRRLAGGAANRNRNAYGAGQTAVRRAEVTLQRRLTAIRAI